MNSQQDAIESLYEKASRGLWDTVIEAWKKEPHTAMLCSRYTCPESRNTFLHHAAKYGNINVCRELIRRGTDASQRSRAGYTAKDLAKDARKRECEIYLDGADDIDHSSPWRLNLQTSPFLLPSSNQWKAALEHVASQDMLVAFNGEIVSINKGERYYSDDFGRALIGWAGSFYPPTWSDGQPIDFVNTEDHQTFGLQSALYKELSQHPHADTLTEASTFNPNTELNTHKRTFPNTSHFNKDDYSFNVQQANTGLPYSSPTIKPRMHDRLVNLALELLKRDFILVSNETNSLLLQDLSSGEVCAALPELIEHHLKKVVLEQHLIDLPSKAVKSALMVFCTSPYPRGTNISYGRAGYELYTEYRWIFIGYNTIQYSSDSPYFQYPSPTRPHFKPKKSRPSIFPTWQGNTNTAGITQLFEVTDLPKEHDLLAISWLILAWMPDRKQVLFELLGDTPFSAAHTQSCIKELLDPATEWATPNFPKNIKQLDDSALNHYLLSFDRVDNLSDTIQRGLLQLLDGKSISLKPTSPLSSEIKVVNPVILNSIESIVSYGPLAERTLTMELSHREDNTPNTPDQRAFDSIFNSLLTIFGQVHCNWSSVSTDASYDYHGGLSDLCRIGVLVAGSLGRNTEDFWCQFERNQLARREFELDENPIAQALKTIFEYNNEGELVDAVKGWQELLEEYRPAKHSYDWPTTARGMGAQLKIAAPILKTFGIMLEPLDTRRRANRHWRLSKIPTSCNGT